MPLSESHTRTLEMRFQHWDRNHSGYLERSDIEEATRRVGETFGQAENSPGQLALTQSCQQPAAPPPRI